MPSDQVIGEVDQAQVDEQAKLDQAADDHNDTVLRNILGVGEKPDTDDQSVKSEDTAEPKPDSVNPDDHKKAIAALKRDRVPESAIKSMTEAEVTAWGLQRAAERGKQDGFGNRLKELQKQIADAESSKEAEVTKLDLAEAVKPFADKFKDLDVDGEFDPSQALQEFGQHILDSTGSKFKEQGKLLAKLQTQFIETERIRARAVMPKHYELDNDDRWQDVVDFRLTDANEYSSEQEAIEAACRQLFADETIAKYVQKKTQTHADRTNGSSTVSTAGKKPLESQTTEQIEDDVLRAILRDKPEDKAKAQRKLGRSINISSTEMMSDERIGVPSR